MRAMVFRGVTLAALDSMKLSRSLSIITVLLGLAAAPMGCFRGSEPDVPVQDSDEQKLVNEATDAVKRMRSSGNFPQFDEYLEQAFGIMIFPDVVKAGFVLGGQGGSGVLLARGDDGELSSPAFFSIGGGSAGAQIGVQRLTLVFFFMKESALQSAIKGGLELGADATVATGTLGGDTGNSNRASASSDIVQLADASGVFAGVSVNGMVVSPRDGRNRAYYGPDATTRAIVIEERFHADEADGLRQALAPR